MKQINPWLDEDDLLRVGGRLTKSELQFNVKHPLLLPQHSKFTEFVIMDEHRKNMHSGVEATLAAVRLRYWPIKARGTIKRLLRGCVICFKARPWVSEQLMGDLPAQRITLSRPFSNTGIDFCGPIFIRSGLRRNSTKVKCYVAVFVCMATKAIHLEVVSDMSTDAFLNAFKRFIARRGKPSDVFTDNGTNFFGANRELTELRTLFEQENRHKIIDSTSADKIKWHFIPPRAPHFGGLWEASVKSFKRHFYKVAANAALTFEEAVTFVSQVEAILNSRPLTPLSSDPNDLSYLTASHFLIGEALTSYPEPDIIGLQDNRLKVAASGANAPALLEALVHGVSVPVAAENQMASKPRNAITGRPVGAVSRRRFGPSQMGSRKNSRCAARE